MKNTRIHQYRGDHFPLRKDKKSSNFQRLFKIQIIWKFPNLFSRKVQNFFNFIFDFIAVSLEHMSWRQRKLTNIKNITVLIHRDEMEKFIKNFRKISNKNLQIFTKRHNIKWHYIETRRLFLITFHYQWKILETLMNKLQIHMLPNKILTTHTNAISFIDISKIPLFKSLCVHQPHGIKNTDNFPISLTNISYVLSFWAILDLIS